MARLEPAQRQRWSLLAPYAEALAAPTARRRLWAWTALAVLSLALAGVMALLLATSRLPGIDKTFPWPLQFFQKGLVVHVVFSFAVWFLAIFGAILHVAAERLSGGRPCAEPMAAAGPWLVAAAFVLLFVPALLDRGQPTLNNYIPVIVDPLYYAGLGLLGAGVLMAAARLLLALYTRQGPFEPVARAALAGAIVYLLALGTIALAFRALGGQSPSFDFNENLFWGGGHVLQFLNLTLMLGAWYVLGGLAFERPVLSPVLFSILLTFAVAGALAGFAVQATMAPFSATQREMFTWLQYALAPPPVIAVVAGFGPARAWFRENAAHAWRHPAFLALALSVATFGIGGMLGIFVDGADTRTPAHYHGVIGGINLAFMGLTFAFVLPLLDRAPKAGRAIRVQIWLYAVGQILACVGLFWAGGYGTARKTAGAAQDLSHIGATIGLYLNGIGALIAIIGGVMFIWTVGRALLRRPARE